MIKRKVKAMLAVTVFFIIGGLAVTTESVASGGDTCASDQNNCTVVWWCCNCDGINGCREETLRIPGFRNADIP